jgi:hypothetical protein
MGTLGALAALPAPAGAAVTIGSDLAPDPVNAACTADCTLANTTLPDGQVTSPIQGVVVRWRVRAGASGGPIALRLVVLRPAGSGTYTNVSRSAIQTFSEVPVTTETYLTQQSIAVGDQIGVDMAGGVSVNSFVIATTPIAGTTNVRWQPPLADGATSAPTNTFGPPSNEVMLNADVEPDCDRDGLGDETQDGDLTSCDVPQPDTVPPDTTISGRPKDKTKKKTATFAFGGVDSGSVVGFQCSLDGAAFTPCTSIHTVKVKKGKHTFAVRAIDQAGNVDPTPATDGWKVKKKKKK